MASDQPVKKKLRIDAPDIDDSSDKSADNVILDIYNSDLPSTQAISTEDLVHRNGESPDSGTVSEDAVDCTVVIQNRDYSPSFGHVPSSSSCDWSDDNQNFTDLKTLQNSLVEYCLCRIDENIVCRQFDRQLHLNQWPLQYSLRFLSTVQLLFDVYLKQNNSGTICSKLMSACDVLVRNRHDWITEVIELADHKNKYLTFLASRVLSSFLIVAKDTVDENWLQQITENVYLFDTFNRITVQKINFSLDIIKRIVEWKDVEQHPLEDANAVREDNPFRVSTLPSTSASSSSNNAELQNAFSSMNTQSSSADRSPEISRSFRLHEPVLKFPIDQQVNVNELRTEPEPQPEPARLERVTETGCITVVLTDSESFDTSHIKCLTIKTLQHHWSSLVKNIKLLLVRYLNLSNAENCILTFFSLWENIISVKANLSVIDTKPFYSDLQSFVDLLRSITLPSLVYTQLLSLFNEVLCYGSTLALQDILPEEICCLAHSIVRFVKDYRLLSEIQIGNRRSGLGFVGYDSPVVRDYSLEPETTLQLVDSSYGANEQDETNCKEVDKNMLQKISLLVLKSVAVTVKEMRCDSSDSSIDSSDYNAIQDMQIVERSIRDVLKKLDTFIKNGLEFHPETPFTKMLVHLFSEQDDFLIESMVCTLDITVGIVYRNSVYPDLIPMLNPMATFIEFLKVVSHDSDVLLDYLVSNETCFLLYLLRFLKYVRRNWPKFLESCQNVDQGGFRGLDETMSVLIRLRLQISRLVSKSLFPYNISPVLRLLEVCESLYEGNELS